MVYVFDLRDKVNGLTQILRAFILSFRPDENSICCVSMWVRGGKPREGGGGGSGLSEPPSGCDREDW